jgi:pimeloyl-ACP methyl ester carboxylesterase
MLAGHDRGGRVAHRLCLDHPDAVQKVAFLDIAPTLTMYNDTNKEFATKYVWWFLQIQPEPMPEHLIGLDSVYYLREHLCVQGKTPGAVTPQAMAEYIRCYCCTDKIHAAREDYRAAADYRPRYGPDRRCRGSEDSSAGARIVGCEGGCRPNVGCACHLAIQGGKPGYRQGIAMRSFAARGSSRTGTRRVSRVF